MIIGITQIVTRLTHAPRNFEAYIRKQQKKGLEKKMFW